MKNDDRKADRADITKHDFDLDRRKFLVTCWTRRYEQLREQVLAGDNSIATDRRGLAVLIREGMAAWMRAWHEPLRCSVAAAAPEPEALSTSLAESWQQEATRLLVNMALSHLKAIPSNS